VQISRGALPLAIPTHGKVPCIGSLKKTDSLWLVRIPVFDVSFYAKKIKPANKSQAQK